MRIVFNDQIFASQIYGGVSRYYVSLNKCISEIDGVESKIISPLYVNSYLKKINQPETTGIAIPEIRYTGRIRNKIVPLVNTLLSPYLIKSYKPNIVHETYYARKTYAPKKAKRIVTVFDMIHERYKKLYTPDNPMTKVKRLVINRADHVICISNNTRDDLIEFFNTPEDKISVVYLGHEISNCKSYSNSDAFPNMDRPYLLFIGRRGDYKNFTGLLAAYVKSERLRTNFSLICFGGGNFNKEERSLFDSYGLDKSNVIHISGDDNSLANIYRKADAYICPSLYEGFGITLLESMSFNCPVICSNTSSIPEVVGDAGEYFDPDDIESIIFAIENVVFSPARKNELIIKGIERKDYFSWEKCAGYTHKIYKSIL
jgi:glycosyltransferase involved in cell wall biosynthesis